MVINQYLLAELMSEPHVCSLINCSNGSSNTEIGSTTGGKGLHRGYEFSLGSYCTTTIIL